LTRTWAVERLALSLHRWGLGSSVSNRKIAISILPAAASKTRKDKAASLRNEAQKLKRQEWAEANRESVLASRAKYRQANKAKVAEAYAEWARNNPEKKEAGRQKWMAENRDKYLEICARAGRSWRQSNPEKVTAKTARRRAQLLAASVAWADRGKVLEFYREARRLTKETGVKHQVDHIVPLQSPTVCGLHNEFNLQVITATENREKYNKFPQRQGRLIA